MGAGHSPFAPPAPASLLLGLAPCPGRLQCYSASSFTLWLPAGPASSRSPDPLAAGRGVGSRCSSTEGRCSSRQPLLLLPARVTAQQAALASPLGPSTATAACLLVGSLHLPTPLNGLFTTPPSVPALPGSPLPAGTDHNKTSRSELPFRCLDVGDVTASPLLPLEGVRIKCGT